MSKIYFQGTYGAYSHLASLAIDSKAEIIPCKTFDECFLKALMKRILKLLFQSQIELQEILELNILYLNIVKYLF